MKINRLGLTILMALLSASLTAADKFGTLSRDTELRNAPNRTADLITTLSAQNKVRIIRRHGGWYEISNNEQSGWVRLLTVKLDHNDKQSKPNSSDGGVLGDLLGGLATGREKSDEVTAATAVRGIDEEELANAEPDLVALELLEEYAVDADVGKAAADEVGLRSKELEYIAVVVNKKTDDNDDQDDWP